jgi:signal transduction histidine kinase
MRLQSRLALATCLFIVPVIVVLVVSVDSVARDRIYSAVDSSLQTKATSIRSAISTMPDGLNQDAINASLPQLDRQAAQGTAFSVVSAAGSLLYSSAGATALVSGNGLAPAEPTSTSSETLTTDLDGVKTRIMRQPLFGLGQVLGYIEVREPLLSADSAVNDIRHALVVGGGAAAVAIVLAVYFLAGQVVAPVRRMSELSAGIQATEDFSRRMPAVKSPREVQELTSTFNAMLQRIQDMIAAQKAFLAESSHELRRPLTILRTNLDLLRVQDLPPDVRASVEEESRAEAEAMSDLVSELLILSRAELSKIVPVEVDLSSTVLRSLSELREYCRDHVLQTDVEANVHVRGDADGLKHVVDNLLENAHSYTPAGGRITLNLGARADVAVLTVTDTGQGMTEPEREHAFDRFFRGEAGRQSGFEGFGLGLAIVKQVVESHSGAIDLASRPGGGTACTVTLPLQQSA